MSTPLGKSKSGKQNFSWYCKSDGRTMGITPGRDCVIRIEDIFNISFIAPEYVAFTFKIVRHFD